MTARQWPLDAMWSNFSVQNPNQSHSDPFRRKSGLQINQKVKQIWPKGCAALTDPCWALQLQMVFPRLEMSRMGFKSLIYSAITRLKWGESLLPWVIMACLSSPDVEHQQYNKDTWWLSCKPHARQRALTSQKPGDLTQTCLWAGSNLHTYCLPSSSMDN